jgi:hypothetical protein
MDLTARRLKVPRSQLCAMALEEFFRRNETKALMKTLNDVYADPPPAGRAGSPQEGASPFVGKGQGQMVILQRSQSAQAEPGQRIAGFDGSEKGVGREDRQTFRRSCAADSEWRKALDRAA